MTTTRRKPHRGAKDDHVRLVPVVDIHPSPENDRLYRPISADDPEIQALAASIREHGVQEPIILERDWFIISGHRRWVAARLAGLLKVPCRVRADVSRREDPDGFLKLLRECNRQRLKTFSEKVREEVVSANPEEAYVALQEHRRQKSIMSDFDSRLDLGVVKGRKAISAAKRLFMRAIRGVLDERREFWPLSDRQVHYALLNEPPLIHASKPLSVYRNDGRSYKALTDLLTRARLNGLVSFEALADETRPVETWPVHADVQGFVRQELDGLLKSFWRDLQQSQPNHIELLVEKNTLLSIIKPVAAQYCIPITSGRGFCSLDPRHKMAMRFRRSGKQKLVLLILADHDPEGDTIATSTARTLRDDFGISSIEAVKVALTFDQVRRFKLPPGLTAKAGSATREKFVAKHGEHVHELEALDPKDLQAITREAIGRVLDVDAYNVEVRQEKQDAAALETIRRRVHSAVEDATRGMPG